MRPIIPIIDIPGDNDSRDMTRYARVIGFNNDHYVLCYGFLKGSTSAKSFGIHSETFTWVLMSKANTIVETYRGLAFELPESFKKVLDDPMRVVEKDVLDDTAL